MTSKPTQTANARKIERFPDFPLRDDMQNVIYLHRPSHIAALTAHFGSPGSTLVLGEVPVNLRPNQQLDQRIPDLLIAFNIDPDTAIAQGGYAILDQGKPPDFVLEVASPTTGHNDYIAKRREYAAFGIPHQEGAITTSPWPETSWPAMPTAPWKSSVAAKPISGDTARSWV